MRKLNKFQSLRQCIGYCHGDRLRTCVLHLDGVFYRFSHNSLGLISCFGNGYVIDAWDNRCFPANILQCNNILIGICNQYQRRWIAAFIGKLKLIAVYFIEIPIRLCSGKSRTNNLIPNRSIPVTTCYLCCFLAIYIVLTDYLICGSSFLGILLPNRIQGLADWISFAAIAFFPVQSDRISSLIHDAFTIRLGVPAFEDEAVFSWFLTGD